MWRGVKRLAARAHEIGGTMTIEWAYKCGYHRRRETMKLVSKYKMTKCKVHGCAYGLASINPKTFGCLLCKAWGFITNDNDLRNALTNGRSDCVKQKWLEQVPVQGRDTAHSGSYPDELAEYIHRTFRKSLDLTDAASLPPGG